jgi:hypothetical protein
MRLTVKVTQQYSESGGATHECEDISFNNIVVEGSNLLITGAGVHEDGPEHDPICYDEEVTLCLSQPELKQIITAALAKNLITLDSPDKDKIEKARQHIDEAMKILAE